MIEADQTSSVSPSALAHTWRWLLGAGGVANLLLAAGFAFQWTWAVGLWPWDAGRLSYIFLGSMLAAVGAGAVWIGLSQDTASLPAGFLNLAVALGGMSVYLLAGVPGYVPLAAAIGVLAVVNVVLVVVTQRRAPRTGTALPPLIRGSYAAFSLVLLSVGLALILGVDGVMPWPVDPPTSVLFGWIFFGDAFYFAYPVARPLWEGARAQLWSFLGYNAVLLGPLIAFLPDVDEARLPNLLAYLAVLGYSTALGVYFLMLNPQTRKW